MVRSTGGGMLAYGAVRQAVVNESSFIIDGELDADLVASTLAEVFNISVGNSLSIDVMFVLVSGYLVFFMQAGFAMLTAGSVRSKNTKNVLLKNVLDACVGSIAYYLFGYAFAYGPRSTRFIASGNFALANGFNDFHLFFFQWAFAATATTIVSGSVAERTSFYAYLAYAFFITGWVYPVVSHWVWDEGGWLRSVFGPGRGVIDFAGCTVVHMVGGVSGLCGAIVVGPRLGRFDSEGQVVPIPGHSATLTTLGAFVLWFGWYGFNPGSALGLSGLLRETASRCAVNTTLAAGAAGFTTLIIVRIRDRVFDLLASLNGILAGLVSITAGCAFVEPYAAVGIGAVGAGIYVMSAMILLRLRIDDPLEAFPIHGAVGTWGALAVGLFARDSLIAVAGIDSVHSGLFYGGGISLFGANLIAAVVISIWTVAFILPMFTLMKWAGILRISSDQELMGNDVSKHGGVAYPIDTAVAPMQVVTKDMEHLNPDDVETEMCEPSY